MRNEYTRGTVKIERLGMKMREYKLRWYGHVMRRDQEYVGRRVMEIELLGKRKRGKPKRRFRDVVKEDMKEVGGKEIDVRNRAVWKSCDYPWLKGKAERERSFNLPAHFDKEMIFSKIASLGIKLHLY